MVEEDIKDETKVKSLSRNCLFVILSEGKTAYILSPLDLFGC